MNPPSPLPMLLDDYPLWFNVVTVLVFVTVAAYLVAQAAVRATRFAARAVEGEIPGRAPGTGLAPSLRVVRALVFVLVALVLVFPALGAAGVETSLGLPPEALIAWLLESGLRIALVLIVSWLLLRITSMVVARFERRIGSEGSPDARERAKRARTLGTLLQTTVGALVTAIAVLMTLRELRLDITPILTGAGIVGLAVGFGAQTLVKDVISGFFLILENQVRVGDVAAINGTGGLVEAITLRTIVLRDVSGAVHVFPNGSITTLSNMSKDYSYSVIDLGLSYEEDPDRVTVLLREIGASLRADPAYAPAILEPLEVFGVDALTESQVTLKLRIKTLPLKQWEVGRELRRRIKQRFQAEEVRLPSQSMTLKVDHARELLDQLPRPAPGEGPAPPG